MGFCLKIVYSPKQCLATWTVNWLQVREVLTWPPTTSLSWGYLFKGFLGVLTSVQIEAKVISSCQKQVKVTSCRIVLVLQRQVPGCPITCVSKVALFGIPAYLGYRWRSPVKFHVGTHSNLIWATGLFHFFSWLQGAPMGPPFLISYLIIYDHSL